MQIWMRMRSRWRRSIRDDAGAAWGEAGLTLVELIIVVTILSILSAAAVPLVRFQVKRVKERELRTDLFEMRRAIDAYKDAADLGGMSATNNKPDAMNYPPDLDTLVNGVDIKDKHVRFLRAIPIDPMTKSKEWGLRSNQDEPDSDSFGGQNVFDVHSKSTGTALDGTKYSTW